MHVRKFVSGIMQDTAFPKEEAPRERNFFPRLREAFSANAILFYMDEDDLVHTGYLSHDLKTSLVRTGYLS